MHQIAHARAGPELSRRWQQQVASQWRRRSAAGPRPLAALSYLAFGPIREGLIDVRRLIWVALHDQHQVRAPHAIRVAGYSTSLTAWGVQVGGPDQCRFEKDLALPTGNHGRRFQAGEAASLTLALDLDRTLSRHAERAYFPRRQQWRWPRFWGAFSPSVAQQLAGSGPEFAAISQGDRSPAESLAVHQRLQRDQILYPLEYVSHAWRDVRAIYADLTTVPKRQVIDLVDPERQLIGFHEALAFDCWHSRFSPGMPSQRRRRTAELLVAN